MAQPAIDISRVSKTFRSGRKALDGITLRIAPGEMVALIGASGSGKSTLLRHMAGLAVADRGIEAGGYIAIDGVRIQGEGRVSAKVREIRAGLGFIFQQFNLVGRLSVLTNVMTGGLGRIPLYRSLLGVFTKNEREAAFQALSRVGIPECALQRASTLSGGQQQRAAIARALVQGARTILADEPIASLDPESSRRVMEILRTINQEDGTTVVVSLHQVDHAIRYCARTIALKQGVVMFDGPSNTLTPAILTEIYGAELDWQDPSHQAASVGDRSADAAGLAAQLA